MEIAIVVAAAENNAIGKDNRLIWRLPDDMKFFKEKTIGHCIVTGRKNYESIPDKFRPLPERTNIVVTRNRDYKAPGAIVVHSFTEAVEKAKSLGESYLGVIGGGEIYRECLAVTDTIWLTRVHATFEDAHTFFPPIDPEEWKETWREEHAADEKHAYAFTFIKLERKRITNYPNETNYE
jgi:dihydrofolate reductase